MELMLRLSRSPKAIFLTSCVATILTGIAILGFGAPPVILAFVLWGGSILLGALNALADRRLGTHWPSSP
jgi:hypothetical protein